MQVSAAILLGGGEQVLAGTLLHGATLKITWGPLFLSNGKTILSTTWNELSLLLHK